MARVTSNAAEVVAGVRRFTDGLGYRGRGRAKSLGEDARDLIAEAVYDQTVMAQQDPDGHPLAPLTEATLKDKRTRGYPETILVRTGHMLDLAQLKGEAEIERDTLELTYGKDDKARQEAEYAHEGSRKRRRRKRPFYGLGRRGQSDLADLLTEGLNNQATDGGCV